MLAWHFLMEDRRLRWGSRVLIEPSTKVTVPPPLLMCKHGLHASERIIDALSYSPGPIVCRVQMSGFIINARDKCCATERTCIWMADATNVLHEFACWCATEALQREQKAGREPPPESWAAIKAKRRWLAGEITKTELVAAYAAACDAAHVAAHVAACDAAHVAAHVAACDAAHAAAYAAACAAAHAAACAAACDAAHVAAHVAACDAAHAAACAAARVAACDAAHAAAYAAACAAQESKLLEMVSQLERNGES